MSRPLRPILFAQFVARDNLSHSLCEFTISVTIASIPKSVLEALSVPYWRQVMVDEMAALHDNGTWELVSLPPGQSLTGSH